jgi:hypothetical protein
MEQRLSEDKLQILKKVNKPLYNHYLKKVKEEQEYYRNYYQMNLNRRETMVKDNQ